MQAERYIWWSLRIFKLQMWNTMVWPTHMAHTEIVLFDMEITLTAQQRRGYPFTFSAQCWEGRWYTMHLFPHPFLRYVLCSHFLSEYDKSSSMQCTLMTKNECWISFSVVGSDTGTTVYDLQMHSKQNKTYKTKGSFCMCPIWSSALHQVVLSLPTSPWLFWGSPSRLCASAWSCWLCGRFWCPFTIVRRWQGLRLRRQRQSGSR